MKQGIGQRPHLEIRVWQNGMREWRCSSWNNRRVGYGDTLAEAWFRWRYGH